MDPRGLVWSAVALVALSSPTLHAEPRGLASSRIIYLVHDGVELRPGGNDSRAGTSTIVTEPVTIPPWTTTPEIWSDTVACVSEIYSRFSVTITEEDPGDVPHLEGVFGGSPLTLGLARSTAGISPFTADCAIIENSIVFTFTDILAGDARSACHVMAQELAHSYGLDHEMLETDPMTFLHAPGDREFADQDVACGEYTPRPCGLGGSTCRPTQNSYALLAERLGLVGTTSAPQLAAPAPGADELGCSATGRGTWGVLVLVLGVCWPRRRRSCARLRRARWDRS